MRSLCLALLAVANGAAAQTHYVSIVNTSADTIISIAAAPVGATTFRPLALGDSPLRGGGESTTVAFDQAHGGCYRDLRTTFANGRALLQKRFNVCKSASYHVGRYLHAQPLAPGAIQSGVSP